MAFPATEVGGDAVYEKMEKCIKLSSSKALYGVEECSVSHLVPLCRVRSGATEGQ